MEDSGFGFEGFNITVVGLGLIGASYAAALRKAKPHRVFGIDIDKETLDKALSMGIIDEGFQEGRKILAQSDLVIIALYPEETMSFLADNARYFKPGAVVTDTCGIKKNIVEHAGRILPEGVEFVGGHPMAGNEFKGIDAASEEIFIGANYIITPHENNTEESLVLIEKLALSIGSGRVIRVAPEEHDSIISYTSQLPHIIAVSVMNLSVWGTGIDSFMGRSIKDTTRVACLNKKLWMQLFRMNSPHITGCIEEMEAMLAEMKKAILLQDYTSLERILDNAINRKRETMNYENA